VPYEYIEEVLTVAGEQPDVKFLFMTKNPKRYFDVVCEDSAGTLANCTLGATVESDANYPKLSKAPPQSDRLHHMTKLSELGVKTFVSVEPILDFTPGFETDLYRIRPWAVAVGYDNYKNYLPEPSLKRTQDLISKLRKAGITVYEKTLRKAWYEP
jgi:DNA repair photolyase